MLPKRAILSKPILGKGKGATAKCHCARRKLEILDLDRLQEVSEVLALALDYPPQLPDLISQRNQGRGGICGRYATTVLYVNPKDWLESAGQLMEDLIQARYRAPEFDKLRLDLRDAIALLDRLLKCWFGLGASGLYGRIHGWISGSVLGNGKSRSIRWVWTMSSIWR